MQIVDARNPLLFRCEDLECYVKEVDKNKLNLILCNKADFLTYNQRRAWAEYFDSLGVSVVFFSALESANDQESEVCFVIYVQTFEIFNYISTVSINNRKRTVILLLAVKLRMLNYQTALMRTSKPTKKRKSLEKK